MDISHFCYCQLPVCALSAISISGMDHSRRWYLLHYLWTSHSYVSMLLLSLANGYFLAKLLLFIFFTGLGIFSGITLFNSNRRESVFLCSRLIHTAAITHERKDFTDLAPFSY